MPIPGYDLYFFLLQITNDTEIQEFIREAEARIELGIIYWFSSFPLLVYNNTKVQSSAT